MATYGTAAFKDKEPNPFHRATDVLSPDDGLTSGGNVVVRVGRGEAKVDASWSWVKLGHVVLTRQEARELGKNLIALAGEA